MSTEEQHNHCDDAQPESDAPSVWVFWSLFSLSLLGFAPCVLIPAWHDYVTVRQEEQRQRVQLEVVRSSVDRQQELIEALRTDPAVIARAAQRELEYIRPGETRVPALSDTPPEEPATKFDPQPVSPPPLVRAIAAHLPEYDYAAVFADPMTRGVIMAMSGGVMIAAFVLVPPRQRGRQPRTAAGADVGPIADPIGETT